MNERGRNESDISRYTDVEYSPEGYKTVYRWGDFLEIAGGHVYNAMDTIDLVSTGGKYEGFNPRYAYTCEFVGCSTLVDGIALFRPVSRDGEDLTQIAFLRSDIDDDTGAYTECFEAGSFDIAAASDIQCSDLGIDLLDYFRGRSFEGLSGVKRGLNGREAVGAVEVATGCDLDLFEDFWLGSPGETDVHVGPYVKRDLIALSYIVNDFSQMYGTTARDIRKLLARVNNFHPDRLAAVKAYLDCEYVTDRDTSDEKTYRWSDFLEIAGGDARYAAMLIERTAPGEKAWPIEEHDGWWGAAMGSFTFDENLAGNGIDYVSPDALSKIMGYYGYHDSQSFLDCNLDIWADELVDIVGCELFGIKSSEALVLSPLAEEESVLQLFRIFSEKAGDRIGDDLLNGLRAEMESEERFAHAKPVKDADLTNKTLSPAEIAAAVKKAVGINVSVGVDGGGKHI